MSELNIRYADLWVSAFYGDSNRLRAETDNFLSVPEMINGVLDKALKRSRIMGSLNKIDIQSWRDLQDARYY